MKSKTDEWKELWRPIIVILVVSSSVLVGAVIWAWVEISKLDILGCLEDLRNLLDKQAR